MSAQEVLAALQAAVDSRDPAELDLLFDAPSVLIGSAADGRDPAGRRRYFEALAASTERLHWDWREVIPLLETDDALGFAAFGELRLTGGDADRSFPFRATVLAVRDGDAWRVRHFHGSVPATF